MCFKRILIYYNYEKLNAPWSLQKQWVTSNYEPLILYNMLSDEQWLLLESILSILHF